jgi:histidinol-phosphate aminotransferase
MPALSRRAFAQLLGAGAAAATLPFPAFAAKPSGSAVGSAKGPVRLSANENPFGPSPKALDAMSEAFSVSCRYPDEAQEGLVSDLAKMHGTGPEQVLLGNGSSEILKIAALAFLSPSRKLVMAAPTFEAISSYAGTMGAPVVTVPLDSSHGHDLAAMGAVKDAGLVYICNPNNPTATITPHGTLASFLGSVPESTIVMVDEAYHHYADSPDYTSVVPLVKMHPNLIVARTFSKIYGMAGLRCGYAVGQHPLIQKMSAQQSWDSINAMALAAARASVADPYHVRNGKKRNLETRTTVTTELSQLGFHTLPSQANFIMIELGRDVRPVIAALREHEVHVGRLFPAMPQHLRVTIGRPEEMTKFLHAFRAVIA